MTDDNRKPQRENNDSRHTESEKKSLNDLESILPDKTGKGESKDKDESKGGSEKKGSS